MCESSPVAAVGAARDCHLHSLHHGRPHPPHQPPEDLQCLVFSRAEAGKRGECELRHGERERRRLDLEAAVPAHRRPLGPGRCSASRSR